MIGHGKFSAAVMATLLVLGFAAVVAAVAEEPWQAPARAARKKNPVSVDDKSLATGKAAYAKECLSCHGPGGKGDGPAAKNLERPPGDLSNPKMWDQTDGALFWKITEGRKPMPGFDKTFTEEQRWHIVNYVRTLAPKRETK